ncbi:MAG: hypothetical protein HQ465_14675 [Rhodospirillales bacterium]|nr:hypothetical protein [Rhodospirillales bacterium]
MRQLTDSARLREFMRLLGRRTRAAGRVYLVGGACAVLHDWRSSTIDIDLDPGLDALLREIPAIKEELQVNVELASPAHFIPELPGWRDRSPLYRYSAIAAASFRRAVVQAAQTLAR